MNTYLLGKNIAQHRTGIVLGAIVGLMSGGLVGLCFGLMIGYHLSTFLKGKFNQAIGTHQKIQAMFFDATFAVMGKLAKADGAVSKVEIAYAEAVMARMKLTGDKRQRAIDFFTQGKSSDYEIADVLDPLRHALGSGNRHARLMFLEIQLSAALVDGQFNSAEGHVLGEMCQILGVSKQEFDMVTARMSAQAQFNQQSGYHSGPHQATSANDLTEAYKVLGVDKSCDDKTLKKAYRRLMNQHHPDKLVAEGVPPEMMQLANEKTQEIQAAYEVIKRSRKK